MNNMARNDPNHLFVNKLSDAERRAFYVIVAELVKKDFKGLSFRRRVYNKILVVDKLDSMFNYKYTTADHFNKNPFPNYHLLEWIYRDLVVILDSHLFYKDLKICYALAGITRLLRCYDIRSNSFKKGLSGIVGRKYSKIFRRELFYFAGCDTDVDSYDSLACHRNLEYGEIEENNSKKIKMEPKEFIADEKFFQVKMMTFLEEIELHTSVEKIVNTVKTGDSIHNDPLFINILFNLD